MKGFTTIRPIKDQAEIQSLIKAAMLDGHRVLLPTHVFIRDGELIGYASVCALVPVLPGAVPAATQVHVWFDSTKFRARDSIGVINALENIARCTVPGKTFIVPCTKQSPFYDYMIGFGYYPIMETTLWAKSAEATPEPAPQASPSPPQEKELR